jgi:hypothetical protein
VGSLFFRSGRHHGEFSVCGDYRVDAIHHSCAPEKQVNSTEITSWRPDEERQLPSGTPR